MVVVKTVEFGLFFGGRQATDQSRFFCKQEYYAWTLLETLPTIGTKGYRLLLFASANHITLKETRVTGYTIVFKVRKDHNHFF